jgi:hypothetical protein
LLLGIILTLVSGLSIHLTRCLIFGEIKFLWCEHLQKPPLDQRVRVFGHYGYIAFLRGKRVTYWGRAGDQRTEWFPGARPIKTD